METLFSIVVRSYALRMRWGVNDESSTPLGILPSLQESTSTWSKSRLRVSSTPITCTPRAGSPWKGMLVAAMSCVSRRRKMILSASRSPLAIRSLSLVSRVNIRNIDSSKSGSLSAAPFTPMVRMVLASQSTKAGRCRLSPGWYSKREPACGVM